jgi:hypothetical protein
VPSKLIQQFVNMLQAVNVEAVKIAEGGGDSKSLLRTLFFASGATGDGQPLDPPEVYVGDYLVYWTNPHGNETAYLTRAQVEVIEDFWPLQAGGAGGAAAAAPAAQGGPQPVGCCTYYPSGTQKENVPQNMCTAPNIWTQSACGGTFPGRRKPVAPVDEPNCGQGHDCG